MADVRTTFSLPVRAEFENRTLEEGQIGDVARPLSLWERITNVDAVRKAMILVVLAAAWELYARWVNNQLMLPAFSDTVAALFDATMHGPLVDRVWTSIKVLMMGYAAGIFLAAVFTTLAVSTRIGTDLLSTLTSMFNPLPAIALLPLTPLWFGLGTPSLAFVIIHSVLWAVALNTHTGFLSVPETQRMAGQNYGLKGLRYVMNILIPAAFPSILAGLKIGWAFAWRTLIAPNSCSAFRRVPAVSAGSSSRTATSSRRLTCSRASRPSSSSASWSRASSSARSR